MSDDQDIREKLKQIEQVVTILEAMDVPNLPYQQWLQKQASMNHPLTGANETELKLKQSEISHLENSTDPNMRLILTDERAELAFMKTKLQTMVDLQTALDAALNAQPAGDVDLDQQVADLINTLSQLELSLKQQQYSTLGDRINISTPDEQSKLSQLQCGEEYEVEQLKQMVPLNQQIADLVHSEGDPVAIADLRRRVAHHELLMKQQNIEQLQARLPNLSP